MTPEKWAVWKYEFPLQTDAFYLDIPEGAEILHVEALLDADGSKIRPFLWAKVDTEAEIKVRRFIVLGTGDMGADGAHIATFTSHDGRGVWHMFEVAE